MNERTPHECSHMLGCGLSVSRESYLLPALFYFSSLKEFRPVNERCEQLYIDIETQTNTGWPVCTFPTSCVVVDGSPQQCENSLSLGKDWVPTRIGSQIKCLPVCDMEGRVGSD